MYFGNTLAASAQAPTFFVVSSQDIMPRADCSGTRRILVSSLRTPCLTLHRKPQDLCYHLGTHSPCLLLLRVPQEQWCQLRTPYPYRLLMHPQYLCCHLGMLCPL